MTESIFQPVLIHIPKSAKIVIERNADNTPKRTLTAHFSEDYVIGNICAAPQFFGASLARRRIGHKIAAAFRGKREGDTVGLPRDLAAELWKAASESDYTSPFAAQLPEEWLWAIPETDMPEPPKSGDTEPPPAERNPPQTASDDDNAAAAGLVPPQGAPS